MLSRVRQTEKNKFHLRMEFKEQNKQTEQKKHRENILSLNPEVVTHSPI